MSSRTSSGLRRGNGASRPSRWRGRHRRREEALWRARRAERNEAGKGRAAVDGREGRVVAGEEAAMADLGRRGVSELERGGGG